MTTETNNSTMVDQDKMKAAKKAYSAIVDQQISLYAALRAIRDTSDRAMQEEDLLKFLSKHAYEEFDEYAEKVELFSRLVGATD